VHMQPNRLYGNHKQSEDRIIQIAFFKDGLRRDIPRGQNPRKSKTVGMQKHVWRLMMSSIGAMEMVLADEAAWIARQQKQENCLKKGLLDELDKPGRLVKTQYKILDKRIGNGFLKGKSSLVFGPPGNAKSMFALNLLVDNIKNRMTGNDSYKMLYIPFEYRRIDHAFRGIGIFLNSWKAISSDDEDRRLLKEILAGEDLDRFTEEIQSDMLENPSLGNVGSDGSLMIPRLTFDTVISIISQEAENRDLIILDPITAIDPDKDSRARWEEEKQFVRACGVLADYHDCHIMLLSHSGKRGKHNGKVVDLAMDDSAGSVGYSRFTQYIMILDLHEEIESNVYAGMGQYKQVNHTRTLKIVKTNFGPGSGSKLAIDFVDGPQMEMFGAIQNEL